MVCLFEGQGQLKPTLAFSPKSFFTKMQRCARLETVGLRLYHANLSASTILLGLPLTRQPLGFHPPPHPDTLPLTREGRVREQLRQAKIAPFAL